MYNNHVKGSENMDMKEAIETISKGIADIYKEYGEDRYIIDRRISPGFIDLFRESLFEKEKSVILLERFIDKDKLDEKEIGYLTGLDKVDDYAKKLEEIKNSDASQEEVDKVIEDISSMIKSTNMLFYTPNEFFGAYPVVSMESLSEDYIASLANSGALFALSYISFMNLVDIKDIEIDSLSFEGDGYTDILIVALPKEIRDGE